jgi:predicted DNA-binding antitoxin AbrB/MazE fold protein
MIQSIEATFDGEAFQPDVPLNLKAGTRVRITVESVVAEATRQPRSFLETAKSLQLQGAPDWSVNIDQYLDGDCVSENG